MECTKGLWISWFRRYNYMKFMEMVWARQDSHLETSEGTVCSGN